MMRSIILKLAHSSRAQRMITHWKVARVQSHRFVAGETLDEAAAAVKELNKRGLLATLDQLGENTLTLAGAEQATLDILAILDSIQHNSVKANVSVKLSQIGLLLDAEQCKQNLTRILERAKLYSNFVRIDMEDSSLTERTLQVYWSMRKAGFENVGIVIQAYLYRSEEDICHLTNEAGRVRLCKGAYQEAAQVAFPHKREVDQNFDYLAQLLIESSSGGAGESADGRTPPAPALATHDEKRILHAQMLARQYGVARSALEFQMLYGIRRDLQERLAQEGYPVRIYVPFGTHWYPYFMRRLAERPANLWFFLSNYLHK